jgi:hypothetical protein
MASRNIEMDIPRCPEIGFPGRFQNSIFQVFLDLKHYHHLTFILRLIVLNSIIRLLLTIANAWILYGELLKMFSLKTGSFADKQNLVLTANPKAPVLPKFLQAYTALKKNDLSNEAIQQFVEDNFTIPPSAATGLSYRHKR